MGHFGPIIEAERDETLSQYLRERGHKTSILTFRLEASVLFKKSWISRHPRKFVLEKLSYTSIPQLNGNF
jgi:hypothetical protein